MNVLVLGSGGREHAFCWKINQSSLVSRLYCAPGNAGTLNVAQNVQLDLSNFDEIGDFCLSNEISIVLVGPEQPLVDGIWDFFQKKEYEDIKLIGPSKLASQLEGSKDFAKRFMARHAIPTAGYRSFEKDELDAAVKHIESLSTPIVLKADGLAAGKGVVICQSIVEAKETITGMMSGKFGEAGERVVIEDFLEGIEFSVFVLVDGTKSYLLPMAKDYKRIGEGDTGLNTGGMGAVSPVPFVNDSIMKKVRDRIITPTIEGIRKEKLNYTGFIFFGLILVQNEPYVIEYNCRMGDPETQVVMPLLQADLLELLESLDEPITPELKIEISPKHGHTLIVASGGYPENYQKGKAIHGLEKIAKSELFLAGVKSKQDGFFTSGGRVLALTSLAETAQLAKELSYREVEKISFENLYFRKDIGKDIERYSK